MDHSGHASFGDMPAQRAPREVPGAVEYVRLADSCAHEHALYDSIEEALRSVVRAAQPEATDGRLDERSLRALDGVCELVRRDALLVEQLPVSLKDARRRLTTVRRVAGMDADVTLACVITHCIEEFYRPSSRS